jgi:hypothetical protein
MAAERRASLLAQLSKWKRLTYEMATVPIKQFRGIIGKLAFLRPQLTRVFLYLKPLYKASNTAAGKTGDHGRLRLKPALLGSFLW